MRSHVALALLCLLCIPVGVSSSADVSAPVPPDTAPAVSLAPADATGGGNFYFCAAAQTFKIIGLFTANAGMVLAGAVAGGVACGMGW
jgi:hypothetical protein